MNYQELLNEEQYNAMINTEGPVLVSAGAGSGKTRLLTYRIAYLITEKGVPAQNILAITFTNKAAGEMKDRIRKVARDGDLVTVCTFHSFCARMLRTYASYLKDYRENFTIFSESDVAKVQREIFKKLNILDESTRSQFKSHLATIKNDNMSIDEFVKIYDYDPDIHQFEKFYHLYRSELVKNNAMDFDDLLINFFNLILDNRDILDSIQRRYTYISVDEFQDTNSLQYDMVKLLASKTRNILIVGDEDQSIYGWRGANIENIFNFTKDFPEAKVFKLEQNYRSTKNIIEKANLIIKNNKNRLDKKLYTSNGEGSPVFYYQGMSETDEADFVIRDIVQAHARGVAYNDMAILMRLNALSRTFEEKLLSYNIPHIMYNGFRFYERAEIKNVLAYLTAIVNPNDDVSFLRVVNFPKRGIGDTSIQKLTDLAAANHQSVKAIVMRYEDFSFPKSLRDKLKELKDIFLELEENINSMGMFEFFTHMLERTGIPNSFDRDNEQDKERYLNVSSLTNSIKEYEENNEGATIVDYLESVTLSSAMDSDDGTGVVIATVHGAKGLEFDRVYIVGCEEKIFPISRDTDSDMEEERRLMYVAVTRAKKDLILTSSDSRFLYGKRENTLKSRFLHELELVRDRKINNPRSSYNRYDDDYDDDEADSGYRSQSGYGTASYQRGGYGGYSGGGYPTHQSSFNSGYNSNNQNSYQKSTNNNYSQYNKGVHTMNKLESNNANQSFNYTFNKSTVEKKVVDWSKVKLGAAVVHPKFGEGKIVNISPDAGNKFVTVKFDTVGEKTLFLDYAPIEFKE